MATKLLLLWNVLMLQSFKFSVARLNNLLTNPAAAASLSWKVALNSLQWGGVEHMVINTPLHENLRHSCNNRWHGRVSSRASEHGFIP